MTPKGSGVIGANGLGTVSFDLRKLSKEEVYVKVTTSDTKDFAKPRVVAKPLVFTAEQVKIKDRGAYDDLERIARHDFGYIQTTCPLRAISKENKMKKTTILVITVLFVFMGAMAEAQQGKKIDKMELSDDEQIEYLDNSIKTYDSLIKDMDDIINIYGQQKTSIIEQRAKLNVFKEMLVSSRKAQLKDRGAGSDAVLSGAAAVGFAATGNVFGATVAGANAVNKALDGAIEAVDKRNAAIEQRLKEQREWKASHPGRR